MAAPKKPARKRSPPATAPAQDAALPKMGRPTLYRPEYVKQAVMLCKLGATDPELADFFDVSIGTIKMWAVQHEDFLAARMSGKLAYDDRVEHALAARALGYEHDEVDIRVVEGQIVQTPIRKHYPPDSTAAIFWLKNRRSGAWKDRTEQKIEAEVTEVVDKEDLARRVIFLLSQRLVPGG
jgi:hypothetical protein